MTKARQGNIAMYLKFFKGHSFIQIFVLKLVIYISFCIVNLKINDVGLKK